MSSKKRLADRIRDGDLLPAPLVLALMALTPAQRLGMAARRMRRVHRVNARVISFGNITAGGTGKTPAVIERAQREIAAGHSVAVLTRGYAAPSGSVPCDSTNLGSLSPYAALGDEATLILQKAPGVIVVKNADRVAGAQRAITLGCDTLILDDGFQQLRLARDEDIVLIDATNPFGNGHIIPRGILREPPSALARASHIIVTRADQVRDLPALLKKVRELAPHVLIRITRHAPIALRNLATGETLPPESLRGQRVTALCGIGNPESFVATLTALGAIVEQVVAKPDHIAASKHELSGADRIVCTEKDAVRGLPQRNEMFGLEIALRDLDVPVSNT